MGCTWGRARGHYAEVPQEPVRMRMRAAIIAEGTRALLGNAAQERGDAALELARSVPSAVRTMKARAALKRARLYEERALINQRGEDTIRWLATQVETAHITATTAREIMRGGNAMRAAARGLPDAEEIVANMEQIVQMTDEVDDTSREVSEALEVDSGDQAIDVELEAMMAAADTYRQKKRVVGLPQAPTHAVSRRSAAEPKRRLMPG